MAQYRLLSDQLPDQNWSDDSEARLLGFRFVVREAGYDLTELSYWVPPQGMSVLTTALLQLWDLDAGTKVAEVDLLAQPPGTPETWMRCPIPPHTPNLAHRYFVGVRTVGAPGRFVFNNTDLFPIISGPLLAPFSMYRNGGTSDDSPTGIWSGFYMVDVTATSSGITGSFAAGLSSLTPGLRMSGIVAAPGAITGTVAALGPPARLNLTDRPQASDVETALLAWLRTRPEFDGFHFGTRRPASLAGRTPYVHLTRTGGAASLPTWRFGPVLDRCGIAVAVWAGPDPADSRQACGAVLDALYAMRSVTSAGLTIVRVASLSGLAPVPDPGAPDQIHQTAAAVIVTNR